MVWLWNGALGVRVFNVCLLSLLYVCLLSLLWEQGFVLLSGQQTHFFLWKLPWWTVSCLEGLPSELRLDTFSDSKEQEGGETLQLLFLAKFLCVCWPGRAQRWKFIDGGNEHKPRNPSPLCLTMLQAIGAQWVTTLGLLLQYNRIFLLGWEMYINLLAMIGSVCNNHCHRLMIRAKQELQCVYYCSYLKKKTL